MFQNKTLNRSATSTNAEFRKIISLELDWNGFSIRKQTISK